MTEIKNVNSQSFTKQIQIQINWVRNNPGWNYRMIFNAAKNPALSGPLKDALKEIGAKVFTTSDGIVLIPISF